MFDRGSVSISNKNARHNLNVEKRENHTQHGVSGGSGEPLNATSSGRGGAEQTIFPIPTLKNHFACDIKRRSRSSFVAVAKRHRLVVVAVLHQLCLREPQPSRSSETKENIGSPQSPALWQFWPVNEIPCLACGFCSPQKVASLCEFPSSSSVGFFGTVASEKVRHKRKTGVGRLLSAVAIIASYIDSQSCSRFRSP
jgi:hypothetical protein